MADLNELKSLVVVIASKFGLMTIGRIQIVRPTRKILPARCINESHTNGPLQTLATNISMKLVVLQKKICIGLLQVHQSVLWKLTVTTD